MARVFRTTVTGNGNTDFTWKPARKEIPNRGSVYVFGTFGSGTVTLQASPDGGTTFIDIPDAIGSSITFTANGMTNFELYGNADIDSDEQVIIRLALAGATSPSITYIVNDIR